MDMAKFVIDYQLALAGKTSKVISPWVAQQTTELQTLATVGGWSMGWMRFESDGNLDWFSHSGSNTGTGGQVMGTMQGGRGIIILANGGNPARYPTFSTIKANVINKLGWDKPLTASQHQPSKHQIQQLTGRYLSPSHNLLTIEHKDNKLSFTGRLGTWYGLNKGEFIYAGQHKFAVQGFSNLLSLEINPENQQPYLTYSRQNTQLKTYSYRKLQKGEMLPYEVASTQDFQATLKAYQNWQQQYPDSKLLTVRAIKYLANRALKQNSDAEAIRLLRTLVALYPSNIDGLTQLADTYQSNGSKPLAIKNYQQVLTLEPNNQHAQQMLTQLK